MFPTLDKYATAGHPVAATDDRWGSYISRGVNGAGRQT